MTRFNNQNAAELINPAFTGTLNHYIKGRTIMKTQFIAFGALIVAAIVTGCGDKSVGHSSSGQNASYILLHQNKIKARMNDPESAQFRNVFVSSLSLVCGEVNAKNGFGGYTGFQRFISGGELQVVETDMAAGEMDTSWPKFCGR